MGRGPPSAKHVYGGTLAFSEPGGAGKVINKPVERTVRKCQESTGAALQDHNSDIATFLLIHKRDVQLSLYDVLIESSKKNLKMGFSCIFGGLNCSSVPQMRKPAIFFKPTKSSID